MSVTMYKVVSAAELDHLRPLFCSRPGAHQEHEAVIDDQVRAGRADEAGRLRAVAARARPGQRTLNFKGAVFYISPLDAVVFSFKDQAKKLGVSLSAPADPDDNPTVEQRSSGAANEMNSGAAVWPPPRDPAPALGRGRGRAPAAQAQAQTLAPKFGLTADAAGQPLTILALQHRWEAIAPHWKRSAAGQFGQFTRETSLSEADLQIYGDCAQLQIVELPQPQIDGAHFCLTTHFAHQGP